MRVPSFLHGRWRDVSRAAKRFAREFARGAEVHDLVPSWSDLRELPGLIVLEGPSPLVGGGEHVHAYALTRAVREQFLTTFEAERDRWADVGLGEPWSFLGLLGQWGAVSLSDGRMLQFLDRAVWYWSQLTELGPRYTDGVARGSHLWDCQGTVTLALARQGVDVRGLPSPIEAKGLAKLVDSSPGRRLQQLLAGGHHDEAVAMLAPGRFHDTVLCALAEHFVSAGALERVLPIIRRESEREDPHGLLATWIADHGSGGADASVADAREAFLRRPDLEAWERLKRLGTSAQAEEALAELARRGDRVTVMWVRVWDGNGERALSEWEGLRAGTEEDASSLRLSAASVARVLAPSRPLRAAELYVVAASALLEIRKADGYRRAIEHLRSARDLCQAAGQPARGAQIVGDFRNEHRRFRRVIEMLDEAGLR